VTGFMRGVDQALIQELLTPERVAAGLEAVLWAVVTVLLAWLAIRLTHKAIGRAVARQSSAHWRTMAPVIESTVRALIVFAALVLALGSLHVNVTALLASAGVVGVALGFGAQYLVRDVLAGFSLLSEGVVQVGDIVRVDTDTGTVERVTLRTMQIRKANGELLTIPNGMIGRLGNLSRDYGVAVVRVTIPYRADIAKALDALEAVATAWAEDAKADAVTPPVVNGAVDVQDNGVVLQLSARVPPGRQWVVEADLRRRAIAAFSAAGIPIDSRVSVTL
jgi:moderate conductance mechanosensitive channel